MMTIEATDADQAIERVALTSPHLNTLLTTGGIVVLREHDLETPVTSPSFSATGIFSCSNRARLLNINPGKHHPLNLHNPGTAGGFSFV